jgi:hypothetical protein
MHWVRYVAGWPDGLRCRHLSDERRLVRTELAEMPWEDLGRVRAPVPAAQGHEGLTRRPTHQHASGKNTTEREALSISAATCLPRDSKWPVTAAANVPFIVITVNYSNYNIYNTGEHYARNCEL